MSHAVSDVTTTNNTPRWSWKLKEGATNEKIKSNYKTKNILISFDSKVRIFCSSTDEQVHVIACLLNHKETQDAGSLWAANHSFQNNITWREVTTEGLFFTSQFVTAKRYLKGLKQSLKLLPYSFNTPELFSE